MIENTLDNKANFFALYYGQQIRVAKKNPELKWVNSNFNVCGQEYLVLRPLNLLTDDDAKMIASIENIGKTFNICRGTGRTKIGNRKKDFRSIETVDHGNIIYLEGDQLMLETDSFEYYNTSYLSLHSYQYLISKGYAVPYMDADVKTLVEWDWIKLLDYETTSI